MDKKKISRVSLIAIMMITAIMPTSFAGLTPETIRVTFTPSGVIDLDLYPITATFGTVPVGNSNEYPDEGAGDTDYTVYNNGTTNAVIYIFSNWTTDGGEWDLDNDGSPGEDAYSLDITGSDAQYITNSNVSWIADLDDSSTVTFGINLDLGTASGSGVLDAQKTTINITAIVLA